MDFILSRFFQLVCFWKSISVDIEYNPFFKAVNFSVTKRNTFELVINTYIFIFSVSEGIKAGVEY